MPKYIKKEDRKAHFVKYKTEDLYFYRKNGGMSTWCNEGFIYSLLDSTHDFFDFDVTGSIEHEVEHLVPAEFLL